MRLRIRIKPLSAFGSELLGETLFGQLCWAIRARSTDEKNLQQMLKGYTGGSPFLVISDAFPRDYLPLPVLPSFFWEKDEATDRKELKVRSWIALQDASSLPLKRWRSKARKSKDIVSASTVRLASMHNSINRITLTTGEGDRFSPYSSETIWFSQETELDLYAVIDPQRLGDKALLSALADIGQIGYGRDASVGLGKFTVLGHEVLKDNPPSRLVMTLSSCSPNSADIDEENTFYRIKTHFGRHGSPASLSANPFKHPVILAQRAAVIALRSPETLNFIGRGICGISPSDPRAVHQGYAPVWPLPGRLQD